MRFNFLGKWKLLPGKSEYAKGNPPQKALYSFKKGPNKSLDVFIKWTDNEGNEFEVQYNIIPDGQRKKYDHPEIAEEVMSEFVSDHQLNSFAYKDGKTIGFTARRIDEEGIMKVVQRFYTSDGNHFDTIQYYKK